MATAELDLLLLRLGKLSPAKKAAVLYSLKDTLDEESFRHLAALLAIDLSRGESPRRWTPVEGDDVVEELFDTVEEPAETYDDPEEVVEDDEYIGKRVVERIWRSSI